MTKRNTKRGGSCQRRPASTVRRRTSAPRAIGVLAPSFVFVGDAIFVQIPIVLCVSCASADASTSSGPRHAHLYSQSVGRHRRPLCFCSAPLAATVLVVLVLVLVQTSRAAVAAGARPPPPQPGERQLPKCPNGTSDTGYSNIISNGSGNNNNSHSAGDIGGGLLGVSPAWADDHSDDERSSSGRSNSTSPVDFGLVGASKVSAANKNVVVGAAVSHCTNDDGGGRFHQNPRATPRHRRTGRHVGREWRSSTSSAPIPTAVTRTIG